VDECRPLVVSAVERFWTVDDLAERWGFEATKVWRVVKELGVPFVSFDKPGKGLDTKGPKQLRFRPGAVMRWEEERERVAAPAAPPKAPSAGPVKGNARRRQFAQLGWDGVDR